jgi:hypothetical protein
MAALIGNRYSVRSGHNAKKAIFTAVIGHDVSELRSRPFPAPGRHDLNGGSRDGVALRIEHAPGNGAGANQLQTNFRYGRVRLDVGDHSLRVRVKDKAGAFHGDHIRPWIQVAEDECASRIADGADAGLPIASQNDSDFPDWVARSGLDDMAVNRAFLGSR